MDIFLAATRLILVTILGAVIGIEREVKNRAVGFRIHVIASVGVCPAMFIGIDSIGKLSSDTLGDTVRIAGQVISSTGFLGAGTILRKRNAATGLTTATALWPSAAIGLVVGIGYYEGAIIATVICPVTLASLNKVSGLINKKIIKPHSMIFDTYNFNQDSLYEFTSKEGVEIRKLGIVNEEMDDKSMIEVTFSFNKNYDIDGLFRKLESEYNFQSVKSVDDGG